MSPVAYIMHGMQNQGLYLESIEQVRLLYRRDVSMGKYTLAELRDMNQVYDQVHRLNEQDVEIVNRFVEIIEGSRNNVSPRVGDIVEYTNKYGMYYGKAHIETVGDEGLYICEQGRPFIVMGTDSLHTSTSGGTWSYIPRDIPYVRSSEKAFITWGHAGACGDGGVTFQAMVSVFEYTEGVHEFTTKDYDMFFVSVSNEPDLFGYKYTVGCPGNTGCVAFRTDKEYQAWLKTFRGVEVDSSGSKVVWTHKQVFACVPLEVYQKLDSLVVDSELCNGTIQECKREYDGTTVRTFMPYQDKRIVPNGVRRFMRAYEL